MIYPIVIYGSPLLRRVSKEINKDYEGLNDLIENMFETMYASDGVGLAAPQIGKSVRVFVIDAAPLEEDDPSLKDFKKVFINPVIEDEHGEMWIYGEGCLSLPKLREDVQRLSQVTIRYQDENLKEHTETYNGVKARIIQHEYDHLEGILFVDKISPLRKKLIRGKLSAITKGKFDVPYKTKLIK